MSSPCFPNGDFSIKILYAFLASPSLIIWRMKVKFILYPNQPIWNQKFWIKLFLEFKKLYRCYTFTTWNRCITDGYFVLRCVVVRDMIHSDLVHSLYVKYQSGIYNHLTLVLYCLIYSYLQISTDWMKKLY